MEDAPNRELGHDGDQARLVGLGELSAYVAHELRNVLAVVASNLFVARRSPEGAAPYLEAAERNTRLAQGIVDDVMALARGEAIVADAVPLDEIVATARERATEEARLQGPSAPPRPVTWEEEVPATLMVHAHPGLLARVLQVLYANALQVTAPGPVTVWTRAAQDSGRVVLEVSDDGPGVRPDIADRMFDPLVSGRPGGTGLGLALALRIVRAHGGDLLFLGSRPGGTAFRVVLPG